MSIKPHRAKQIDIEVEDGESEAEFMQRCLDEGYDAEVCEIVWEDRSAEAIRFKKHAEKVNGLEFVLSDETPDRMDDIIIADGWTSPTSRKIRSRCSGISRVSRSAHGKTSAS